MCCVRNIMCVVRKFVLCENVCYIYENVRNKRMFVLREYVFCENVCSEMMCVARECVLCA